MNYKKNFERMLNGIGTTYSKAVAAMCYQCSGYDYKEARECSNKSCPLWIVKYNKKRKKLSKTAKGINNYSVISININED